MTILEIAVQKKKFFAAQEALGRIRPKETIRISQGGSMVVYRILIEDERREAVIRELRNSLQFIFLCGVFKNAEGFPAENMQSEWEETHAFRGLDKPVEGGMVMRRMFGFQVSRENDEE